MKNIILIVFLSLLILCCSSCERSKGKLKEYYEANMEETIKIYKTLWEADSATPHFMKKNTLRGTDYYEKWKCQAAIKCDFYVDNRSYTQFIAWEFSNETDAKNYLAYSNGIFGYPKYKIKENIVFDNSVFMYFLFDDYKVVDDMYLISNDGTTFIGLKDGLQGDNLDVILPKSVTNTAGFALRARNEDSNYYNRINKIVCNENLKSIGDLFTPIFSKNVELILNEGLEYLASAIYENHNKEYADIIIPSTVKYISENAFYYCALYINANRGEQLWNSMIAIGDTCNIYYKENWEFNKDGKPVAKMDNCDVSKLKKYYDSNIEDVKVIYQQLIKYPYIIAEYHTKEKLMNTVFSDYNCQSCIMFKYLKDIEYVSNYSVWEFTSSEEAQVFMEYLNNKEGFDRYKIEGTIVYEDIVPMYYLLENYKVVEDYMILSNDETTFVGFVDGFDAFNFNFILPESIISIAGYAFNTIEMNSGSMKKIEGIVFNENLKTIGSYAFENVYISNQLILNEGLESIGDGAFNLIDKSSYADILIPSTLKYIGNKVFNYCNIFVSTTVEETTWDNNDWFWINVKFYYKDEWKITNSGKIIITKE